jgi:hypothetical protein
MLTTPVTGDDVVDGKLPCFFTTILAGKPIAVENLEASQLSFPVGTLDHVSEADYRGQGEAIINGVDKAHTVLQHFRLAMVNEHHGTPSAADGKWLVALIQYQYGKVYHLQGFFLYEDYLILLQKF